MYLGTDFQQWLLFHLEDLKQWRQLKETKENKQLVSQSTSIPFMNINDITGCKQKAVLFDSQNGLVTKIDKLTAKITKFLTQNDNRPNHSYLGSIQEKERSKQK